MNTQRELNRSLSIWMLREFVTNPRAAGQLLDGDGCAYWYFIFPSYLGVLGSEEFNMVHLTPEDIPKGGSATIEGSVDKTIV